MNIQICSLYFLFSWCQMHFCMIFEQQKNMYYAFLRHIFASWTSFLSLSLSITLLSYWGQLPFLFSIISPDPRFTHNGSKTSEKKDNEIYMHKTHRLTTFLRRNIDWHSHQRHFCDWASTDIHSSTDVLYSFRLTEFSQNPSKIINNKVRGSTIGEK